MIERYSCPHCRGRGTLMLTGVYAETLARLRRIYQHQDYVVANRIAWQFECSPTALNNRLARLEELGFLRSEIYGRARRFYLWEKEAP